MAHPPALTTTARDLGHVLRSAVARRAHDAARRGSLAVPGGTRATGVSDPEAEVLAEVLAEGPEVTVVRLGGAVAKAHAEGTDAEALGVRLRIAADRALAGVLLPPLPLAAVPRRLPGGRLVTLWPYGEPVDPARPEAVPWDAAGRLLAALHAVDLAALPGPVPVMGGPARTARVMARMRALGGGHAAAAQRAVEAAWAGLPAWCRDEAPVRLPPGGAALCHGDFHLGQLVRESGLGGRWRLIDVDDIGLGDPAWDLARPAAWYAAGLLPREPWQRLLAAYGWRGDPWPRLDAPARALTVHFAARSLVRAAAAGRELGWEEEAFVDACVRIGRTAGHGSD